MEKKDSRQMTNFLAMVRKCFDVKIELSHY